MRKSLKNFFSLIIFCTLVSSIIFSNGGKVYALVLFDTLVASPELNTPCGVAVDAAGNVYIADTNNYAIKKRTTSGTVTTLVGSEVLYSPRGVAVDADGNVYIADTGNNVIRKRSTSGTVTTLVDGLNSPRGVAVDTAGNLYIADTKNNAIKKKPKSGNVTTLVSGLNNPSGVAVDTAGNVYIADTLNNKIKKRSTSGTVTTLVSGLNHPSGVAVDTAGNVYIADTDNSILKKRSTSGNITTVGFGLYCPCGVAVDTAGNLYIADTYNSAIKKLKTYTVTFNSQGGSDVSPIGYTISGDTVTLPVVPTKTGYTFAGWNTVANGSGSAFSGTTAVIANVTVYAQWTALTYNVTYNGNGNTGGSVPTDSINYTSGQTVTVANNTGSLVKTGYTFAGWNTVAVGSGTDYAAGSGNFSIAGNTTLYAKWTATIPTFVGGTTTLTVDENASATDIKSLLHVSDSDSGQTETWTESVPPSHGTLAIAGATTSSGSTDITPGGTITYQPNSGYVGSDSFTIQVSDGTTTVTKVITVTVNMAPPTLTEDITSNDTSNPIDITFTDNETWRGAITQVKVDGSETASTNCTITAGKITFNAGVLSLGNHTITVVATGYNDVILNQSVKTIPPTLTADSTGNMTGIPIDITFTDDVAWRSAITQIKVDGSTLPSYSYLKAEGYIRFYVSVLGAGTHIITVAATGYTDATVSQVVNAPLSSPPSLMADSTSNDIESPIDITFTDNATWRGGITQVKIDGSEVSSTNYTITAGKITFNAGVVMPGFHVIQVMSSNYYDTAVNQIVHGTAPILIADNTSNNIGNPIEITFTDNELWRSLITQVQLNGGTIDSSNYTITAGKITLNAGLFTLGNYEGIVGGVTHSITVKATGYNNTTVSQILYNLLNPPTLVADNALNDTANPIDIVFTDNATWRQGITQVKIDGSAVSSTNYTITGGKITFNAGVLSTGTHIITLVATPQYNDATVSQVVNAIAEKVTITSGEGLVRIMMGKPQYANGKIPFVIDSQSFSKNLISYSFDVIYDPTKVGTVTVDSFNGLTKPTIGTPVATADSKEKVTVSWNGTFTEQDLNAIYNSSKGILFKLNLVAKQEFTSGETPIEIDTGGSVTFSSGSFSITGTSGKIISGIIYGDVNGDGAITSSDTNLINKYVSGKTTAIIGEAKLTAADVNGDGSITAEDAKEISNYISGKASTLKSLFGY